MSKYYNRTKAERMAFATTREYFMLELQTEMRMIDYYKQVKYLENEKQKIEAKLKSNPYDCELLEDLRDVLGGLHSLGVDYPIKIKNDEIMYKNYVIDYIDMTEAN